MKPPLINHMGSKYKTKNMDYNSNEYGMKNIAREGNKAVKGLINKDVAVKKRRLNK